MKTIYTDSPSTENRSHALTAEGFSELKSLIEDNVVEDANLRNFLKTFLDCVNSGNDIVAIPADEAVSPNKAAGILSMSRTHLYKLLDRGEIPFHRVGRDRRIFLKDINEYVARREGYRKQLAEDFARLDALQAEAIDELAESF